MLRVRHAKLGKVSESYGGLALAALLASCLLISVMNMALCRPCRPLSFRCRILIFPLDDGFMTQHLNAAFAASPHAFIDWHFLPFQFFALRLLVNWHLSMEGLPHLVALGNHCGVYAVPASTYNNRDRVVK